MPEYGDARIPDRFWSKVEVIADASIYPGPCWIWTKGGNGKGYGKFWNGQKEQSCHRYVYERLIGVIQEATLDHLCRVTWCCNPEHLEPVTHRINVLRGISPVAIHASATHCPYGHEYTPENTYRRPDRGRRECRQCMKRWAGHPDSVPHAEKTHCPQGHPYDEANTYTSPRGDRQCRECIRKRSREYQRNKRAQIAARTGRR